MKIPNRKHDVSSLSSAVFDITQPARQQKTMTSSMATFSAPPPPWPISNPNPRTTTTESDPNSPQFDHHSSDESYQSQSQSSNSAMTYRHETDADASAANPTSSSSSSPKLLHVGFNQDIGCFSVGTTHGFRIHNTDPYREIFRRDFAGASGSGGGIGYVEMLFRCNILALVGGGPDPQYPLNKVMIWDDHASRCIGELSFRSEVKAVKLRRDRIVVVLEQKIFVYNFGDLKLVGQIETFVNKRGLCEISHTAGSLVLVCPGLVKGQIRVEHYATKRTKFVTAHDSRIACLGMTLDGQLVATASSKGTLVRVFNANDGSLLQEVRRGADRAEIYSLAFSPSAQWLAVSSDKGTVHVFNLKSDSGSPQSGRSDQRSGVTSPRASLSFIKGVLPKYFNSEWSVAQFHLVEGQQYIIAFGHRKNTVIILGMDGSFYRCEFDPVNGGEMTQLEYHNFLKPEEAF